MFSPTRLLRSPLLLLLLVSFASSCQQDIIPDKPKDSQEEGGCRIEPNSSGLVEANFVFNSNIQEYFKLRLAIIGPDRKAHRGSLGRLTSNDISWDNMTYEASWEPEVGSYQLAVEAQQLKDFDPAIFAAGYKIDFSLTFTITTPDDGYQLTWCGVKGQHFDDEDSLYDLTMDALNRGRSGGLSGTGTTKYVQFDISAGENGGYVISDPIWLQGNIIDRK